VTFLNDAYGGSPAADRNLYVNAVTFNGQMPVGACSGSGYQKVIAPRGCYLASTGDKGQWPTVIAAPGPTISTVLPSSGQIGTAVTISGNNFGATQGTSSVLFNGVSAGIANNWSATSIAATVPANATTGPVTVNVAGVTSNGVTYTVNTAPPSTTPPVISSVQVSILAALACGPGQPPPAQHNVVLTWTASTSTGITAYNVYRSVTSGSGYAKIGSTTSVLNYTDSTVMSGLTYYYVVTALAGTSESTWSNQASVSIP
jgi:hypothetical protein